MRPRTIRIGLVATAVIGLLWGAPARAETVLRARLNSDILSTDPGINRDDNTDTVLMHVVEGLVAFREDTTVGPMLAETYDTSADGLTYTFRLRQGVRFHNGAELGADDVVWTWRRLLTPATRWRCLSEFDGSGASRIKVLSVEAADPITVRFRLQDPSALFLTSMARTDCGGGGIIHRDSLNADGTFRSPIGTGPFRLAEWRPGQFIELARFERYSSREEPRSGYTGRKDVRVDRVRFLIVPDSTAAKAALLTGGIHVLSEVAAPDVAELAARPDLNIQKAPSFLSYVLLLQTNDPALRDVRVRRAIAQGLDTKELADAASQGEGQANNAAIPVSSPYYGKTETARLPFDPAAARSALAAAGYGGQPIRIMTNHSYPEMMDAAVLAQAMLAQVGVKAELDVVDWATEVSRFQKGDYQMMAFAYSGRLDPSLSLEQIMGPKATQPRKVWDDPVSQALLVKSMQEADRAKRQALFDELTARMLADVPIIYLYNPQYTTALRREVRGYESAPGILPRFWGVALRP